MPFDPFSFYQLALDLAQSDASEAQLRSAISRAYYAGHLLAREGLVRKGWEPTGSGSDHGGVITAMRTRFSKFRTQAEKLNTVRRFREHADYHLDVKESSFNEGCQHCAAIRKAPETRAAAEKKHWEEVKDVCDNLIPLLRKI